MFRNIAFLSAWSAFGLLAQPAEARIIRVGQSTIGFSDGETWETPYMGLQEGIDNAQPGDQIWIKEGTYKTSDPDSPWNPNASYHWNQLGISIYGGFAGTETSLEQRDVVANPVILDGDADGDGDYSDNTRNMFSSGNGGNWGVIDGVTIKGASNSVLTLHTGTRLVISNCVFKDNRVNDGVVEGRGLALRVVNTTFEGNYSNSRGTISVFETLEPLFIQNCVFKDNHSNSNGAAISGTRIEAQITNCLFLGNSSQNGGALHLTAMRDSRILSSTFVGNSATATGGKGGGMHIVENTANTGKVKVQNSIFWQNSAETGYEIYLDNPFPSPVQFGNNLVRGGMVAPYLAGSGTFTDLGGNLSSDPLFVGLGNYRLSTGSPAIDGGILVPDWDVAYPIVGGIPVDLDGNPRRRGPTNGVDIGAFEFQGSNHYVFTTEALGCGTISPPGPQSVPEFTDKTFHILPSPGCRISSVSVDGVLQPDAAVRGYHTFVNVTAGHSIQAVFISSHTIPFLETWESGAARWVTNFAAGDGVKATGNQNKALCVKDPASNAGITLVQGPINAFSIKFKASAPTGFALRSTVELIRPDNSTTTVSLRGDQILIDNVAPQTITLDAWHEVRANIDIGNSQIWWYLDNSPNPFYFNGFNTTPFDRIKIQGGNLDACWDDLYLGNEYDLTVNDPANGSIRVASGWVRSKPGPPETFVYRHLPGSGFPIARLEAVPEDGYVLDSWIGSANMFTNKPSISLPMDGSKTVTAAFIDAPTYTVHRTWNGVTQPVISVKEGVLFNTLQNLTTPLNPPLEGFSNWVVKPGPGYPGRFSPVDQHRQGRIYGGNVLLEAQFYKPKVFVEVQDVAYLDKDGDGDNMESEPRIRITNKGKTALSDFYLEYYFHSECLNTPEYDFDPALNPQFVPLNGGNFKVKFHVTSSLLQGGSLLPGEREEVVSTGRLYYDCSQEVEPTCPAKWNWEFDYSLGRNENLHNWGHTEWIPVYESDPGVAYPPTVAVVDGSRIPGGFKFEEPVEDPTKSPTRYAIPFSTDLPIPEQYPNLVTVQAYPLGTTLVNGSLEQDTLGWQPHPGGLSSDPFPRWEIGFHSVEAPAYDGFRYLKINAEDEFEYEGAAVRIEEGDPSFSALIAQEGKGITGQGAVMSAWARLPAPGTGSIRFAMVHSAGYHFSDPIPLDPTGAWTFVQIHHPELIAVDFGEIRTIILAVTEGESNQGDFHLDGVTLTPGNTYSAPNLSHKLSNTRGAPLQTRVRLPAEEIGMQSSEGMEIISNTEYDYLGREAKSYLPYAEKCQSQSCNLYFQAEAFTPEVLSRANQHYDSDPADGLPNAGGYAYTEKRYEKDQVTTVDSVGKPGTSYQVKGGHIGLKHYSGVRDLTIAGLRSESGTFANPGNKNDPVYAYSHAVDEDGKESMEWKNGFGQVVQSAGVLDTQDPGQYTVTKNIYDAQGNLIKKLPPIPCQEGSNPPIPADCVWPTTYDYDGENRLILESHPDIGETRHYYDRLGRNRGTQTYRQFLDKTATVSVYDGLGRIRYTGEYKDSDPDNSDTETADLLRERFNEYEAWPAESELTRVFTRFYYDRMPPPVPDDMVGLVSDFRLYPEEAVGTFENTKSRLCAVVQYHDVIQSFDPSIATEGFSSTAYRYDRFGRVIGTYTYNGFITDAGFKLQRSETDYDLAGRVVQTRHYRTALQAVPERTENYTYNSRSELSEITDKAGASLARYEYFPENGRVRTLHLGAGGSHPVTIRYQYHISGALERITSSKSVGGAPFQEFSQQLYYDLLPGGATGLFNGNIARQDYRFGSMPSRSVAYQYDRMDRLVNAAYSVSGGDATEFDEQIEYLLDGRIAELRRGAGVGGSTNGGRYRYHPGMNRLSHVEAGRFANDPRAVGTQAFPAFLYDEDGNTVWDQSKNMEVVYDYRGLPTRFSFVKDGLEYELEARYDHGGNRISKVLFTKGATDPSNPPDPSLLRHEILVDSDPSRVRDFGLLSDAYHALSAQMASVTEEPGIYKVYVVVDPNGRSADLENFAAWQEIPSPGGTVYTQLIGVVENSPEYFALLNNRSEVMQLVHATHYTGFGNEIREDFQVNVGIKTLIDLPKGLGRYEDGGGELYYVNNHLGSTMLATQSQGVGFQAYDYYPFGMQKVLQSLATDKVREAFTGKELDDETGLGGLNYFGSRYYDPDLGMWISPDPARQFASLYLYAGNGGNPIYAADMDGYVLPLLAAGATVGGVIVANPSVQQFAATVIPRIPQLASAAMISMRTGLGEKLGTAGIAAKEMVGIYARKSNGQPFSQLTGRFVAEAKTASSRLSGTFNSLVENIPRLGEAFSGWADPNRTPPATLTNAAAQTLSNTAVLPDAGGVGDKIQEKVNTLTK